MSDPFRQREIELLLLWPRERRGGGQGVTQRAEDAQAALDPIRADGIGNSQQIATRIMSFVSFHGAILKQGVGHVLSDGKRISKYFSL
jgi:hypothetical protein